MKMYLIGVRPKMGTTKKFERIIRLVMDFYCKNGSTIDAAMLS